MALWLAGESWGLLAMEYHVSTEAVFAGLLAAIRKVGITLTTPTPRDRSDPGHLPAARDRGPSKAEASPTSVPAGTPPPTPASSSTGALNQVLDPVTTLLGQLLKLLVPPPSPIPSPAP